MSYFVIIRGPLGCGKTTIAKNLSKTLKAEYISIDETLEKHKLDTVDPDAETIPVENFIRANTLVLTKVRALLKKMYQLFLTAIFSTKWRLITW